MKVLCVGDVVGSIGCGMLRKSLPSIKQEYAVDVCIVNGENAADGNGLIPAAANDIFESGADVITGGNHTYKRREIYKTLNSDNRIIRPGNYPPGAPGRGYCVVNTERGAVAIINLLGVVYMEPLGCPFETLDKLLEELGYPKFCVVDFHAEATAEKKSLAFYADGRVSAVFGTHTHVQTADEQVLPNGTGYITDVGMTGPTISVLGIRPDRAVAKMQSKLPTRFSVADGPCQLDAVLFTLSDDTGKTVDVKRINIAD